MLFFQLFAICLRAAQEISIAKCKCNLVLVRTLKNEFILPATIRKHLAGFYERTIKFSTSTQMPIKYL